MGKQIKARLYLSEFAYEFRHPAFPDAGHGIAEPPGGPTTDVAERMGGTAQGNGRARELGWSAIQRFVARALDH
jgi:hypothetical protein